MTARSDREKQKQVQEKCQGILSQLLRDEDNKYCVDCDAKGPRWASWNLGVFLCIRCAGIHRNLGVHISKVKSVNLDTWTPEQVASLQQMGNSRARAVYEANLPDNFRRPQTDSSLEAFIRSKYEQKKFIAKEWVPPPVQKLIFDTEDDKKKSREKKPRSKGTFDLPAPTALSKPSTPTASSSVVPPLTPKSEAKHSPKPSAASVDLLGLDEPSTTSQGDDPFGNFLSATSTETSSQPEPEKNSEITKSNEEDNFFNQTVAEEPKKQQLTKESILSLYGQSSTTQPQQQQPMFGVSGGLFVNQQGFPAQPVAFTAAPVGIPVLPNGVMGPVPTGNILPGVQPVPPPQGQVGASMVGTNPFLNPAMYSTNLGQAPSGMSQNKYQRPNNSDLMWDYGYQETATANHTNAIFQPNFYQLHQQLGSLNLTGNNSSTFGMVPTATGAPLNMGIAPTTNWSSQPAGHTLSTNLWQ